MPPDFIFNPIEIILFSLSFLRRTKINTRFFVLKLTGKNISIELFSLSDV